MFEKSRNFKMQWKRQWKEYKKTMPHWAKSFKPSVLAKDFIKTLNKNKITSGKILEIGCGVGRDAFFISEQGFDVTGVDIAPEAIAFSKQRRRGENKNVRVKFLVADAEKLPFKNNYFDGAYSIGVFHSTNLKKSLKELARVLKKNGLAIIHLYEKTIFLPSNKLEVAYSSAEIKKILKRLPLRILNFRSNIGKTRPDYDEKLGLHKHSIVIMFLKRI